MGTLDESSINENGSDNEFGELIEENDSPHRNEAFKRKTTALEG